VLNSIVGTDILPKADGICTRVPIRLQLRHTPANEPQYGQFAGEERKITDMDEVCRRITEIQDSDEYAGGKKNIVDKEIVVTLHLSTCPDLTVVDLPGHIVNLVEGQTEATKIGVAGLIKRYAEMESTIIMCVSPGN